MGLSNYALDNAHTGHTQRAEKIKGLLYRAQTAGE